MNADVIGALTHLEKSWKSFTHKGKPMMKSQVEAVLQYAINKGYQHTGELSDDEVDGIIALINKSGVSTQSSNT